MKKVAIIFIGTSKYLDFFPSYYDSCEKYLFPGHDNQYFVFTDGDFDGLLPKNVTVIEQEHLPFPYITLYRFDIINRSRKRFKDCDYILFLDADTKIAQEIELEEIFDGSNSLVGAHHPCHYLNWNPHDVWPGSFETNPKSRAHITKEDNLEYYWQGCVWGGERKAALKLAEVLDARIKEDEKDGVMAKWHDESHLNRYFLDHSTELRTLSPSYAYPEIFDEFFKKQVNLSPKIVHLAKENSVYHT